MDSSTVPACSRDECAITSRTQVFTQDRVFSWTGSPFLRIAMMSNHDLSREYRMLISGNSASISAGGNANDGAGLFVNIVYEWTILALYAGTQCRQCR